MAAIEASTVGVRTMADGTLRLSVDIEPRHAQAAFRLFGAPGTALALAGLKAPREAAASAPAAPVPKGGAAARWLGMRCAEPAFQQWLAQRFPAQWQRARGSTSTEIAACVVRAVCGVESRAAIDNDARAGSAFDTLIREPWQANHAPA